MQVVVLESPFSGDIPRNVAYAQRIMMHARERKEIVIIPHLLWTQHHMCKEHFVSDFDVKFECKNGGRDVSLEQIKELRRRADLVVFYTDHGWSNGMTHGLEHCKAEGINFEERQIGNIQEDTVNAKFRTCNTNADGLTLSEFIQDRK